MVEPRPRGGNFASGALKSRASASVSVPSSRVTGEPHPHLAVLLTVRLAVVIRVTLAKTVAA